MTDDLVAFLRARLDDDEYDAKAAQLRAPTPWRPENWDVTLPEGEAITDTNGDGVVIAKGGYIRAHLVRHDPARVLADVAAKRRIINLAAKTREWTDGSAGATAGYAAAVVADTLRLLAAVYADHPDYEARWKP